MTLHRRGDTRRATELWQASAAAAQRKLDAGEESYNAPMELAAISAIEGHTDAALEWLERGTGPGWKDVRLLSSIHSSRRCGGSRDIRPWSRP